MILTRFTVALAALGAWCVLATAAVPDTLIPVTLVFVTMVSVLPVAVPSLAVTEARAIQPSPRQAATVGAGTALPIVPRRKCASHAGVQGGERRQRGYDFVFPQP